MPTTTYRVYDFGINDVSDRTSIISAGGQVMVTKAGKAELETLYDPENGFQPLTQPVEANYGRFRFAVLDSVMSVDVYGVAAQGSAFMQTGIREREKSEYYINAGDLSQVARIPFSAASQAGDNTETPTLKLPVGSLLSPFAAVNITEIDATETINFGLLSSETGGDADGIGVGVSVATAGVVALKSATTATRGALIGAGTLDAEGVVSTAVTVSYTLSAGSDTAEGFLVIPYTRNP